MTGARILEVPGEDSPAKADRLASSLRELFPDSVRVTRPVKCADLRISGLDDSVEVAEVTAAVAKTGGCPADQVKDGPIRTGPSGLGTVILQCPLAAAKLLEECGRILVGWSAARVMPLVARPLKCFRCFEVGHTALQCRSSVDRSKNCFRCDQSGHRAASCSEDPRCEFCDAAGRRADHVPGGCKWAPPPKPKKARKAGKAAESTPAVSRTQARELPREE